MNRFATQFFRLLCFVACILYAAFAQEAADQPLKLSTDLVVLDAQVLNKKTGSSLGNLQKEDFSIYEDGVLQQITHFSQDKLALSILLLVDTSGSVWDVMDAMRQRTSAALQQLKETDEIALMATASRTSLIQGFTKDKELIAAKISTIDKKALGNDGILLHEALYQAAMYLSKAANPASRRVIVVVTDNISTQKIGRGHSEKDALNELYEAGGVVCGLNVSNLNATVLKFDPFFYAVKGLLFRGDINSYAAKTGGIVLKSQKDELDKKLSDLISHLRTRYVIGYVSSNTKQDGSYRKIKLALSKEVEKRQGQFAIITRRGYFAKNKPGSEEKESRKPVEKF
jgi:Ca-activated chloride channel family protein